MRCHRGCTWAELVRSDPKCSGGSGVVEGYVPSAHAGHGREVYTSPAAASVMLRCSECHTHPNPNPNPNPNILTTTLTLTLAPKPQP